jgi:hypothetical protein
MIYAEFIARDRNIPWEVFRHHARQDWASEQDRMVANLGRTMKLGPEPHYMCWWQISSLARLDEWEAHFREEAGRLYLAESPVVRAMNFYRCGLYDVIHGEGEVSPGLHLIEFFSSSGMSAEALGDHFAERSAGAGAGRLAYVIHRVGLLAPDPGGMALWSFASYVEAEPFIRRQVPADTVRIESAGLYRNFGDDIP